MSPWVLRVGRLALGPAGLVHADGWRRLFWRVWWRLPRADLMVEGVRPRPLLHWSPGPEGLPLCGASRRDRWTIEYEHATCAVCRDRGWPMVLQHSANTR